MKDIETIDTLKKTMHTSSKCALLQNQESKERLDTLKKTINITSVPPSNVLVNQEKNERLNQMHHEQVDNITFFNDDYRNVELPANAIIYCDIPYRNTEKYNSSIDFDYDAFYDWCIEKKKQGYQVFISEYSMPEDKFECVFEIDKLQRLSSTKSSRVTEKIFVPKNIL